MEDYCPDFKCISSFHFAIYPQKLSWSQKSHFVRSAVFIKIFVRCNEQKTQEQSFEEMMSRSKKNGGSRWLEWWVFLVIITKLLLNFTQCCTQWLLPLLLLLSHFIVFYNIRVCVSCTGLPSNNFYNNLRGNKVQSLITQPLQMLPFLSVLNLSLRHFLKSRVEVRRVE